MRFTPIDHRRADVQYWFDLDSHGRVNQDPRLRHMFAEPTPADMHLDAALSSISIMHANGAYIGDRVFPNVPVGFQSDKYFIYPKGSWMRNRAAIRAPSTNSRRGGYVLSTDSFYCNEWAFHTGVSYEARRNADAALTPDATAAQFVTDAILLSKEIQVASLCLTSSNWESSDDYQGHWKADSGNTFIADMEHAIELIRKRSGRRPNVLILDPGTFKEIKEEPTVLDRIKYVERGIVTTALIAAMFDLDEVLLGDAIEATNAETLAEADADFTSKNIWEVNDGKGSAFLFYRPPAPGLRVASAGYTFTWLPRGIRRWPDYHAHEDVVEAFENYDVKVTAADLGHLFIDTIQD